MDECECCGTSDVPLKGYRPSVMLLHGGRKETEPVLLCQVCSGLPVSSPGQHPNQDNANVIRVLCHLTNLILKRLP